MAYPPGITTKMIDDLQAGNDDIPDAEISISTGYILIERLEYGKGILLSFADKDYGIEQQYELTATQASALCREIRQLI